jgi:hypothetical protein
MSWVAEQIAIHVHATTVQRTTCEEVAANAREAIAATSRTWLPRIQRRFVEKRSTAGLHRGFAVHGIVRRLAAWPTSEGETPMEAKNVVAAVLTTK